MALQDALKTLAETEPSGFAKRMAAVAEANREIARIETELGLPASLPVMNAVRAKAKLEKLQAQLAGKTPAPAASAVPAIAPAAPAAQVAKKTVPATPPREFKSSGDKMIDAAMRASGSWCLNQYKLKMRHDELAARAAQLPPQSLGGQAVAANLAEVETELARYK